MSVITNNIQPSSGQALTIKDEGGTASITVATNGEATFAENIKISASKGIDFSAVTSGGNFTADNNVLDDYEHGDFEIVLSGTGGGTLTLHSTYKYGTYTRIGNVVHVNGYANIDSVGNASGTIQLNLPYPVSSERKYEGVGPCLLYSVLSPSSTDLIGAWKTSDGTSKAILCTWAFSAIYNTSFSNNEEIPFSLTYQVA